MLCCKHQCALNGKNAAYRVASYVAAGVWNHYFSAAKNGHCHCPILYKKEGC